MVSNIVSLSLVRKRTNFLSLSHRVCRGLSARLSSMPCLFLVQNFICLSCIEFSNPLVISKKACHSILHMLVKKSWQKVETFFISCPDFLVQKGLNWLLLALLYSETLQRTLKLDQTIIPSPDEEWELFVWGIWDWLHNFAENKIQIEQTACRMWVRTKAQSTWFSHGI